MKSFNTKNGVFPFLIFALFTMLCSAQDGSTTINRDKEIDALLELKKEINTSENNSDRYKIQIYSGNRSSAEKAESNFRYSYGVWSSKVVYETPNYKTWIGSFRTRLEADRALIKIQRKFPSAFIFKPRKKDAN